MSLTADRGSAETETRRASDILHLAVDFHLLLMVPLVMEETERGILTSVAASSGYVRLARTLAVGAALAAIRSGVGSARLTVARLTVREAVESRRGAPVALGARVARPALTLASYGVALTRTRALHVAVAWLRKIDNKTFKTTF